MKDKTGTVVPGLDASVLVAGTSRRIAINNGDISRPSSPFNYTCMQWIALAFGVLSLPGYIGTTKFEWTQTLLLVLPWFLAALIYHESWERYKEQTILREYPEANTSD